VGVRCGRRLLATGTLQRLEKDRADPTQRAVATLQRVSGIGSVRAHELYTQLGISDLPMLAVREQRGHTLRALRLHDVLAARAHSSRTLHANPHHGALSAR
jgi:hypothetical protein